MPGQQASAFKHEAKFSAPDSPGLSSSPSNLSDLCGLPFIQCGQEAGLVAQLTDGNKPQLQAELCGLLASLVARSSDYGRTLLACPGTLPALLTIATGPSRTAAEPATLTLAHLAGLEPAETSSVNSAQVLSLLLRLVNINRPLQFLRQLSSALYAICSRGSHPSPQLFHALHQLLHHFDQEVVERACWALAAATHNNPGAVRQAVQGSVVPRLCELLGGPVEQAAIRSLSHIAASDCQALVACGTLPSFHQLLASPHTCPDILQDTIHILEEVCSSQLQAVIDSGLVEPLLDLLDKANNKCSKAAAQVLHRIVQGCSREQLMYMVSAGVVPTLCHALLRLPLPTLLTLHALLQTLGEEERTLLCHVVEGLGAVDSVEALQHHTDLEVYHAAHSLLAAYFPCFRVALPLDECGNHATTSC